MTVDIKYTSQTVEGLTEQGRQWIYDNLAYESWQVIGNAIAIDRRYIMDIIDGAVMDGLIVSP